MRRGEDRGEPIEPAPITCRLERAASLLGVSPRMLADLARDGVVPSFKIADRVRLFRVADLENWAAELPLSTARSIRPRPPAAGRLGIGGAPS